MQVCEPSCNTFSWPWSQLHKGSGNHYCRKQYAGAQLNETWNSCDAQPATSAQYASRQLAAKVKKVADKQKQGQQRARIP